MKFRRMFKDKQREEGFTLIEILIVILIMGILSAIAIPAFMNQRKSAFDASLRTDIKSMALSIETWQVKNRTAITDLPIPTDSSGWTIVAFSSPEDLFVGTKNISGEHIPEGLEKPELSKGNALGVMANKIHAKGGYCIVGNASGGTYRMPDENTVGVSRFATALYYDSVKGGLYEATEIPSDGACYLYHNRIKAGI